MNWDSNQWDLKQFQIMGMLNLEDFDRQHQTWQMAQEELKLVEDLLDNF